MKKITKNFIEKEIIYWCNKFNIKKPIIKQDNRIKWTGYITTLNNGQLAFVFNLKGIGLENLYTFIFHELGHIYHNTQKLNNHAKWKSEYLAEGFAILNFKKYFPKKYKHKLKMMKKVLQNKKWCKTYPIHAKAFKAIYQNLT